MEKVILSLGLLSTIVPVLGMEPFQDKVAAFKTVKEIFAIAAQIKRDAKTKDGFELRADSLTGYYPDSEYHQTAQGTALICNSMKNALAIVSRWGLSYIVAPSPDGAHHKEIPQDPAYVFNEFRKHAQVAYMHTKGHQSAPIFKDDSPIAREELDGLRGTDAFIYSTETGVNSVYAITHINDKPQPETKLLPKEQRRDRRTIVDEWSALREQCRNEELKR